jgi:hypothetical protein
MVWSMSYRPKPDSYPLAEVAEGNSGELELEDMTPDGGVGLRVSRSFSGRRALPESVPMVIRWMRKRPLLDYETSCRKTVSARFRALIEEIEPGVHQFEPIRFIAKDGAPLADRWFWQICNRIDSVHRERTNWFLDRGVWFPPPKPRTEEPLIVFDVREVAKAQFWHDKHGLSGTFVSDAAKTCIEAAGITGVHFHHYEQA